MINQTSDPRFGTIAYDTTETFYHVYTPQGWIGELKADKPTNHPTNLQLTAYTGAQPYAHIYSRLGAIRAAMVYGGTPMMITRTGKVRIVRD